MKLIVLLIVALALAVLGAQNTQAVTFEFFLWDIADVPVVAALFGALLVGALLGWAVSAPGRIRGMLRRRDLQHQVATAAGREADAILAMEDSRSRASRVQRELDTERAPAQADPIGRDKLPTARP